MPPTSETTSGTSRLTPDAGYETLSPRQRQVCDLIVEGLTSKAIAAKLGTTVHTIKAHRAEVMRKLNTDTVADLVRVRMTPAALPAPMALPPSASRSGRPLRVVVIEDQHLFRDMLVGSLKAFGHEAIGLDNGDQVEAIFKQKAPDVLILDVSLGCEETGLDIAERVRRSSRCGIIFMSSHARLQDRMAALDRGADAYFVKPVSFVELNAALNNLASRLH